MALSMRRYHEIAVNEGPIAVLIAQFQDMTGHHVR